MSVVDGTTMEIENAFILFADFTGEAKYHSPGIRFFGVKIQDDSPENEARLTEEGWTVKRIEDRPAWGLSLKVFLAKAPAFPSFPALVISPEELVSVPMTANLSRVDMLLGKTLVIYGERWEHPSGQVGLRAYLAGIK